MIKFHCRINRSNDIDKFEVINVGVPGPLIGKSDDH